MVVEAGVCAPDAAAGVEEMEPAYYVSMYKNWDHRIEHVVPLKEGMVMLLQLMF